MTTVYNRQTGRLEEIGMDRNGNGKTDTRAYMDGAHLRYIALDRQESGHADRWEYYSPGASRTATTGALFDKNTTIVRAEEANGPDPNQVTRWEYYDGGTISRVEEDTDFDGHVDKWEFYDHGALARLELDLTHQGKANRRLIYSANGTVDRVEVDKTGDGHFVPLPAQVSESKAGGSQATGRKGGEQ